MNELEKYKARMAEIVNELKVLNGIENLSDEQITKVQDLGTEFKSIKAKADALEASQEILNLANTSTRQTTTPAPAAIPANTVTVKGPNDDKLGFNSYGDFIQGVANRARGKNVEQFNNSTAHESIAEDGGVLIPPTFLSELKEKVEGDESLLSRTSGFNTSGNHLSLPVDEDEPWNGGIKAYWMGEGQQYTESKGVLGMADFRLHKLGALVKATDELLEDAAALESYIRRKAPSAIVHKINDAIIGGDGAAKPEGIINSSFTYEVAAEGGQAADTIVYENLIKMEARLIAGSNGVWFANPACKEQLRQLKDANGNHIYMNGNAFPNMAALPFDMLLGKPIVYMMGAMPALGDSGDIVLADMSYYYSLLKTAGIKQDVSTHLYFDRDITAFKFSIRVDGKCPFKSPITTQYGNYQMSGFVKLAAR